MRTEWPKADFKAAQTTATVEFEAEPISKCFDIIDLLDQGNFALKKGLMGLTHFMVVLKETVLFTWGS